MAPHADGRGAAKQRRSTSADSRLIESAATIQAGRAFFMTTGVTHASRAPAAIRSPAAAPPAPASRRRVRLHNHAPLRPPAALHLGPAITRSRFGRSGSSRDPAPHPVAHHRIAAAAPTHDRGCENRRARSAWSAPPAHPPSSTIAPVEQLQRRRSRHRQNPMSRPDRSLPQRHPPQVTEPAAATPAPSNTHDIDDRIHRPTS